jgi:membrane-associated phospholipid phosphatase
MHRKHAFTLSVFAFAGTAVSCLVLDHPVALWVWNNILKNHVFAGYVADMPDILPLAVVVMTTVLWAGYRISVRWGGDATRTGFFRLAAWAVPLAFTLKSVLKPLFGRMTTRFWLHNQAGSDFHWLQGGAGFNGFPSGHMAVTTAFCAAAWGYYPRVRPVCVSVALLVGGALIVTDYHFLGDVLAGAYLGIMVAYGVDRRVAARGNIV